MNQCPACGSHTAARICCGIDLEAPFVMTTARIRKLRRYAHGQKGLDEETYRLHLAAVGATSTRDLTREQHTALLRRLGALPDRPRRGRGGAT
ncbi:hypothetical protein EIM50_13555 [Pseudoxanthomonas sp. SGD-10]|nr:hypothetical protein EIM50_13555 [Pseudoxanthomonas sp. SGD-10]